MRSYINLFLAILLWSLIPAISKLASLNLPISTYLLFSNFLSMLIIAPFVKFRNLFQKRPLIKGAIFAILGVFGYYLLLYSAYKYAIYTQNIVIIQYLWPTFTIIFATFILKEKLNIKKIIAIFISFFAFILTITEGFKLIPKYENSISLILAIIAAIFFALYSTLSKKLSSKNAANDLF